MASTEAEAPVVVDEPSTAFEVVHQLDTAIETKTHEEEEAVLFKMCTPTPSLSPQTGR